MTLSPTQKGWSLAGIAAFLVMLPNLGKGMDFVVHIYRTPEVAFAAYEQAQDTDKRFERYLTQQDATAKALQQYIQQQGSQPRNWTEQDAQGNWWVCDAAEYNECWDDQRWRRE